MYVGCCDYIIFLPLILWYLNAQRKFGNMQSFNYVSNKEIENEMSLYAVITTSLHD